MYTHETIEAFSDALAALYSAPTSAEAIQGMLPALGRAFSSRYVIVDELPDAGAPVLHACTHADEIPSALSRYPAHAHELPSVKFVRAGGFAPAYRLLDFATERELGATTIYHELMRPAGLRDQIGLAVRLKHSGLGITINRDRAFSDEELLLASLLRPHLAAVLSGVRHMETDPVHPAEHAPEQIRLTREGDCAGELSSAASALLLKYFPAAPRYRLGSFPLPENLSRWIRVQGRRLCKLGPGSKAGASYAIHGPHGQLLLVLSLTVPGSGLVLRLSEERHAADWFRLRARGLTPRECEVAFWINQGKRDAEIAIILGTAIKTIGKHVERILRKLV